MLPPEELLAANVARILSEAFDDRHTSQGKVAEAVGISQPSVSRVLANRRDVTVRELALFCRALGLDVVKVMAEASKPESEA